MTKVKRFITIFLILSVFFPTNLVVAYNEDLWVQNNIIGYDPNENLSSENCISGSAISGSGETYVNTDSYGGSNYSHWDGTSCTSVNSQRENFLNSQLTTIINRATANQIPWEAIVGQVFAESGGAIHNACPNNPLGLKTSGPKCDGSHTTFNSLEDAYDAYINQTVSVKSAKGKFTSNPYSFIEYIEYGVDHGQSYAQCSKTSYLSDNTGGCRGHQLGDPTPNYVGDVSSLICGVQKWALEHGIPISSETFENYQSPYITGRTNGSVSPGSTSNPLTTSSDSSTINSNVTWTNGWIDADTFPGYVKEDATSTPGYTSTSSHNNPYNTTMKSGETGPNKITLHATIGGNGSGNSGLALYEKVDGKVTPAHFTIDLKNKKVYQHFSIYQPSEAIKSYDEDAGIQIEIIGYDANYPNYSDSEFYIPNYSASDFAYLADLLSAISAETGIPLTSTVDWSGTASELDAKRLSVSEFRNYEGILGHIHTPSPNDHSDILGVWDKISAALSNTTSSYNYTCNTSSSSGLGSVSTEGGLTYEQAKQFVMNYGDPANASDTLKYVTNNSCNGGKASNCASLSVFLARKFAGYTLPPAGRWGNGFETVKFMGKWGMATDEPKTGAGQPRIFSVFSSPYGGPNGHTAIVLGHHDGKWIVAHASCSRSGSGRGNGTKESMGAAWVWEETSDNPLDWHWTSSPVSFAYPDVNVQQIEDYVNNGP